MKAALWGAAALAVAVIVGVLAVLGGGQLAAHASHGVHKVSSTTSGSSGGANVHVTVPPPTATVTVTAPPSGSSHQIPCQLAADQPGGTNGELFAYGMNIPGTFQSGQLQDETCTMAFGANPADPAAADENYVMTFTDSNGNVTNWLVSYGNG